MNKEYMLIRFVKQIVNNGTYRVKILILYREQGVQEVTV